MCFHSLPQTSDHLFVSNHHHSFRSRVRVIRPRCKSHSVSLFLHSNAPSPLPPRAWMGRVFFIYFLFTRTPPTIRHFHYHPKRPSLAAAITGLPLLPPSQVSQLAYRASDDSCIIIAQVSSDAGGNDARAGASVLRSPTSSAYSNAERGAIQDQSAADDSEPEPSAAKASPVVDSASATTSPGQSAGSDPAFRGLSSQTQAYSQPS